MPRKPRFFLPDIPVHIVQRGHSREPVFFEDGDYQAYLGWLLEAAERYDCPNISHDPDTMAEIRSALAVGKEVITHTDAISVPGWSGAGYIIFDPLTGDGAYKISGGANGSFLDTWADGLGLGVGLALAFTSLFAAIFSPVAAVLVVILSVLTIFVAFMNYMVIEVQTAGCPGLAEFGQPIEIAAMIGPFFGTVGVAISAWVAFLTGGAISSVSNTPFCEGG